MGQQWRKVPKRSFDDVSGARFRPSDIPMLRGFRVRRSKARVLAPTDPIREVHDRPTRPVPIPHVSRCISDVGDAGVEPIDVVEIMRETVRPAGERVTVPIVVQVPAFARRSIEPRHVSVPRVVAPAPAARPSGPRALLFAIGLAAGLALGWAAQSLHHERAVATHAVLR